MMILTIRNMLFSPQTIVILPITKWGLNKNKNGDLTINDGDCSRNMATTRGLPSKKELWFQPATIGQHVRFHL